MFYVYLLRDPESGSIYVGYSSDLRRRVREHASRDHPGWMLVYYEAYGSEVDARRRERRLKHHGSGLRELRKRLEDGLSDES